MLSRRNFLKCVGLATTALIISDFRVLLPFQGRHLLEQDLFNLRVVALYGISSYVDYIIRYDVKYNHNQYYAACEIKEGIKRDEFIDCVHNPMVAALKSKLREDRVNYRHLQPLQVPSGYSHPGWFTRLIGE